MVATSPAKREWVEWRLTSPNYDMPHHEAFPSREAAEHYIREKFPDSYKVTAIKTRVQVIP